jgi:hypothetical protein
METTTGKVLKKVANLFIVAGWLWLFHSLGWITFIADMPLWQTLALTALVAWLVEWIFDMAYLLLVLVTLGLGCLLLPIVMFIQGWVFLVGAEAITHWFTINVDFWWLGFLMSVAIGLLRIPSATSTTSSSEN